MNQFTQSDNSVPEIVFQGAVQIDPRAHCDDEILSLLEEWDSRPTASNPGAAIFELDDTFGFTISYDGKASGYWPDPESNMLSETLVRSFLFSNGICELTDLGHRLYLANYKLIAMDGQEYQLVCPFPTVSGNIGGLVVVCLNKRIKQPYAHS